MYPPAACGGVVYLANPWEVEPDDYDTYTRDAWERLDPMDQAQLEAEWAPAPVLPPPPGECPDTSGCPAVMPASDPSQPAGKTKPPPGFDSAHLEAFLGHVLDPAAGPLEARILGGRFTTPARIEPDTRYGTILSGHYDDPKALMADASKLRGVSACLGFNPVNPALRARSQNRLKKAKATTTDKDVTVLRWFFLDIDSVRPSDISATAAERAASARLEKVLAEHPDVAAVSLAGSSGNGSYLIIRILDYANDPEHRQLLYEANASFSGRSSDDQATIDLSTKNASRIGPLPGTLKCKGEHLVGDREWRLVTLTHVGGKPRLEAPDTGPAPIPLDLRDWLARHPVPPSVKRRRVAPAPAATPDAAPEPPGASSGPSRGGPATSGCGERSPTSRRSMGRWPARGATTRASAWPARW